ncbi:MAG TPA: hypothetical protein ENK28_04570 [Aliiroseovarius sp.]|nr:hypothetical protein [Aliiroseovarius sp.]
MTGTVLEAAAIAVTIIFLIAILFGVEIGRGNFMAEGNEKLAAMALSLSIAIFAVLIIQIVLLIRVAT